MSVVLLSLLAAVVVGWARGGSLERLGALPLRSRRLLAFAFVAQLAGVVVGGPFHALGLVVSVALVVAFLLRNRGVRGTGLLALGLLLNALVVVANGAMPVSTAAAARAGVSTAPITAGADARHELSDATTRLPWLADVVPVPLPVRPEVISPGDVLVAAGAAQLVAVGMAPGAVRRASPLVSGARPLVRRGRTASGAPPPEPAVEPVRPEPAPPSPGPERAPRPADRSS